MNLSARWRRNLALPLPRNLLVLFLPWAALICLLSALLYDRMLEDRLEPLLSDQLDSLGEGNGVLERHLSSLRGDLQFLSQQPLLARAIKYTSPDSYAALGQLFREFSDSRGSYDQIRWLDESGMEQVRVSHVGGQAHQVPGDSLQNKAGHDYFAEAMRLQKGDVYLSRFDLNREYGRLEIPLKPTLRAATPVFGEQGERRGILILDYLGKRLLQRLEETSRAYGGTLQLLDHEGYWLLGERPEDAWGFMQGKPDATLASRQPAVWRRMQESERGSFTDASGVWAFSHFQPGDGTGSAHVSTQRWLLLSHLPNERIQALRLVVLWRVLLLLGCMLGLGLLVSVRLAVTEEGRLRAQRQLQASSKALENSNRELRDTVDQLQRTRRALLQAEKLSSLGTLVAGVAHELNTPLGAASVAASSLLTSSQELQASMGEGLKRATLERFVLRNEQGLGIVLTGLERMAQLTRAFKQLASDRAGTERRTFDLSEVVHEVILLLQPRLRQSEHRIELDMPQSVMIDSYPGPLGQILQNLIDNALIHAFEPGVRGVVRVRIELDERARHCLIEVSDNGQGMPPEILAKIFDPFFTTRRGLGGTGLGLHITHQLAVDILGAQLDVVSAPGQGSCFSVRLDLP
ncbi:hypothetical protein DNK44_00885 [Pseudomonas dryadis]|uniref:histidine kinase n=1 Tax=Phytopseudomonas dryadis TaxID=2487520 RepID=A0A4Q9RA15_9GAMM|nr:hypothetical protein DNK44_00885 [Pseudomonas dryadis]